MLHVSPPAPAHRAPALALAPHAAPPVAADHPDAELLELGRRLDAAMQVWRAFRPTHQAADRAIVAAQQTPEVAEALNEAYGKAGDEGFVATYRRIFGADNDVIQHG